MTTNITLEPLTYISDKETFSIDPLVLSVACKELSEINSLDTHSLNSSRVTESVNDSHREQAEKIRDYYCKKLFWNQLKNGNPLSEYRLRMLHLLENRVTTCKNLDTGIYWTLPYFYDEDQVYDQFRKTYITRNIPIKREYNKPKLTLTYVDKSLKFQRRDKKNLYWFTDSNYLYCIELERKNPLLGLFEERLSKDLTITFETYYNNSHIADLQYYKLFNFSIIKD